MIANSPESVANMPKLIDFFTQFHTAELLITIGIIALIVGIREKSNIKKWLGSNEEKDGSSEDKS